MRRLLKNVRPCAVAWLLAVVGGSAAEATSWHVSQYEHVLGTSLELKLAGTATQAAAAETAALAEIDRLGKILSGYDETSDFRRWFATQGEPQRVAPELFEVLAHFDTWRERTGGALDAAAEGASRLWKDAARAGRLPTTAELAAVIALAQQPHWRLDPVARTATHLSTAPLILNSLTKSFIIERACAAAMAAGPLESAVVNIGGDLVVRGRVSENVRIVDPVAAAETDEPLVQITVRDRAVATSGGYRNGVQITDQWYSHIVDPRTAQPTRDVFSATVVAPRATDAGALATALCVVTPDEGLRLVAAVPGAACLLVLSDGRRVASAGWQEWEPAPAAPAPRGVYAALSATAGGAGGSAPDRGSELELAVNFELAAIAGGRARRPFVAIWIEDKDGFPLRTVALWYNGGRWLPDLRSWYHADQLREMAEGGALPASVSSATRPAGRYTVKWDGKDRQGRLVPPGTYTVGIEVAREHGTHQLLRHEVAWGSEAQRVELPANVELAAVSIECRRRAGGR